MTTEGTSKVIIGIGMNAANQLVLTAMVHDLMSMSECSTGTYVGVRLSSLSLWQDFSCWSNIECCLDDSCKHI